jgi:hypothetical protein
MDYVLPWLNTGNSFTHPSSFLPHPFVVSFPKTTVDNRS